MDRETKILVIMATLVALMWGSTLFTIFHDQTSPDNTVAEKQNRERIDG